MFKVVTITGEYGSGVSAIAKRVAQQLGWTPFDDALLYAIAQMGEVDLETVRQYDERVESWWHRFHLGGLRSAAVCAGANVPYTELFDADTVARLAQQLIATRAEEGKCVIVGRGAQCILQTRQDAFHVFVYAPLAERIERVQSRVASGNKPAEYIHSIDHERACYLRSHFGCDWKDPHLYNLMISSQPGEETAVEMIVDAMRNSGTIPTEPEEGRADLLRV